MEPVWWFLGLVWAAVMIWLGHLIAPIWAPLFGAIVGALLYVRYRPAARRAFERDGVIKTGLTIFVALLAVSFLLYGIGRGSATILR